MGAGGWGGGREGGKGDRGALLCGLAAGCLPGTRVAIAGWDDKWEWESAAGFLIHSGWVM